MANLIDINQSFILLVDVQEKLLPQMHGADQLVENIQKLLNASKILDLNLIHCEQYPKGLGNTIPSLQNLTSSNAYEKTIFSACGNTDLVEAIEKINKKQCIITGIEAHVCILQTVSDLLNQNIEVFIPFEAVSSRTQQNKDLAVERMRAWGAQIVSLEQVFFEWLRDAKNPKFKEIAILIK